MTGRASVALALSLCGLASCSSNVQIGNDCDHVDCGPEAGSAAANRPSLPEPRAPIGEITKVDLLLVVDDSASMGEEQAALAKALPAFVERMVSGELDGSGASEFYSPRDLHVGVVSSDLGLLGGDGVEQCAGAGQDGVLQSGSCGSVSRNYAKWNVELQLDSLVSEAVCRSALGVGGCGFEQLLLAPVRALAAAPSGHGDDANEGFLRDDSLLIVLAISDEDDCSLQEQAVLVEDGPAIPGAPPGEEESASCLLDPSALAAPSFYIDELSALHPMAPDRVMFFAITGVPPELTSRDALQAISLEDAGERERFYRNILEAPAMNGGANRGTADVVDVADKQLVPVCAGPFGPAYPGRRLVEVARGFGVNGLVQSICDADLTPALDAVLRSVGRRLGPVGI